MSAHMNRKYARNYRKRQSQKSMLQKVSTKPKKSGAERMRELRQRRKEKLKTPQERQSRVLRPTINRMRASTTSDLTDEEKQHKKREQSKLRSAAYRKRMKTCSAEEATVKKHRMDTKRRVQKHRESKKKQPYECLQVSVDPDICTLVQSHIHIPLSETISSDIIPVNTVVKSEPVSDSDTPEVNGSENSGYLKNGCASYVENLDSDIIPANTIIKSEPVSETDTPETNGYKIVIKEELEEES